MIPLNITRQHVIRAFDFINQNGISKRRKSRTWFVNYKKKYPPKYTISIANMYANDGQELHPSSFITTEAVTRLKELGFTIGHY